MATTLSPDARAIAARRAWMPRQHGAWAMLLVPILVGIAASSASPWHAVLIAAAITGYLFSATLQSWSRSRRSVLYQPPLLAYGASFGVLSAALLLAFPALLLVGLVAGPASYIVFDGARPGTKRDLVNSLAQVVQAMVLVPAAAWISGTAELPVTLAATGLTTAYLIGTVLAVRSVIRERSNGRFAVVSIAFHLAMVVLAALTLTLPYVLLAAALAARSAAVPLLQRRLAGTARPFRPIHSGMIEIVAALLVVGVALAYPLQPIFGG